MPHDGRVPRTGPANPLEASMYGNTPSSRETQLFEGRCSSQTSCPFFIAVHRVFVAVAGEFVNVIVL